MNTSGATTAYFNNRSEAEAAMSRLEQIGIPDSDMTLHHASSASEGQTGEPSFIDRVKDFFTGEKHDRNAESYDNGALLTVFSGDPRTVETLRQCNGYMQYGESGINRDGLH